MNITNYPNNMQNVFILQPNNETSGEYTAYLQQLFSQTFTEVNWCFTYNKCQGTFWLAIKPSGWRIINFVVLKIIYFILLCNSLQIQCKAIGRTLKLIRVWKTCYLGSAHTTGKYFLISESRKHPLHNHNICLFKILEIKITTSVPYIRSHF